MASSSVNPPSPLIKQDSPQHASASSRDLRAARREEQRVQDQLNATADLSKVRALMDHPAPVAGDVNIATPPRRHVSPGEQLSLAI